MGLTSAVLLMILSHPAVWVDIFGNDQPIFSGFGMVGILQFYSVIAIRLLVFAFLTISKACFQGR